MKTTTVKGFVEEFNEFFHGLAEVRVNGNRVEITIGSRTLLIGLPEIIGGQSKGSL